MKITVIVEGRTEKAFMIHLRKYISDRLPQCATTPKIIALKSDHGIPKENKLNDLVHNLLNDRKSPSDYVIALTDVYPDFQSAQDAKAKMRRWVENKDRFFPHVANHDFEAWLLPYWSTIQKLAGHNMSAPSGNPERVNHNNPPSKRIKSIFEAGKCRDSYNKPRDGNSILSKNGLSVAVEQCQELRALVCTILSLCTPS